MDPTASMHSLGRTVRRLRDASNLTQQDLADAVGISASHIAHIESDRRDPSLRVLREVSRAVEVWPGLLLAAFLQAEMPWALRPVFDAFLDDLLASTDRAQLELPLSYHGSSPGVPIASPGNVDSLPTSP